MMGVRPRPLRYRGRLNRRGRKLLRGLRGRTGMSSQKLTAAFVERSHALGLPMGPQRFARGAIIHAADPMVARALVENAPWFADGAR
jgi:hypothetical protein